MGVIFLGTSLLPSMLVSWFLFLVEVAISRLTASNYLWSSWILREEFSYLDFILDSILLFMSLIYK